MKSINFTSSLPSDLLVKLDIYARKFKVPKNHILELALKEYFDKLKQQNTRILSKKQPVIRKCKEWLKKGLLIT